jgi:hypothetical protein
MPMGYFQAWLEHATNFTGRSGRNAHMEYRFALASPDGYHERAAARKRAKGRPELATAFEWEVPLGGGEPEEPLSVS